MFISSIKFNNIDFLKVLIVKLINNGINIIKILLSYFKINNLAKKLVFISTYI